MASAAISGLGRILARSASVGKIAGKSGRVLGKGRRKTISGESSLTKVPRVGRPGDVSVAERVKQLETGGGKLTGRRRKSVAITPTGSITPRASVLNRRISAATSVSSLPSSLGSRLGLRSRSGSVSSVDSFGIPRSGNKPVPIQTSNLSTPFSSRRGSSTRGLLPSPATSISNISKKSSTASSSNFLKGAVGGLVAEDIVDFTGRALNDNAPTGVVLNNPQGGSVNPGRGGFGGGGGFENLPLVPFEEEDKNSITTPEEAIISATAPGGITTSGLISEQGESSTSRKRKKSKPSRKSKPKKKSCTKKMCKKMGCVCPSEKRCKKYNSSKRKK